MDKTLQVDPAVLRAGSTRFDDSHSGIVRALRAMDTVHEDLQGTWTGSAADVMRELWDEHVPTVSTHAAQLSDYAKLLKTTAGRYESTESQNATNVNAAGGPLNL